MKLFSRRAQLTGPPSESMAWAADIRAFAAGKLDREIALWSALFGAPLGSVLWVMRVEGIADLNAITTTLMGDEAYHGHLAKGQEFITPPGDDMLAQPIHGELGEQSPPVGAMAMVTTATIANGAYADAFAWGVDMAQYVESVTGAPTMFLSNQFGPFGGVTWVGVLPDGAAVDDANAKMIADDGYLTRLAGAKDLFIPGSGNQSLITRIA